MNSQVVACYRVLIGSVWLTITHKAGHALALHAGMVLFTRLQELRDHLIDDMAWGLD